MNAAPNVIFKMRASVQTKIRLERAEVRLHLTSLALRGLKAVFSIRQVYFTCFK